MFEFINNVFIDLMIPDEPIKKKKTVSVVTQRYLQEQMQVRACCYKMHVKKAGFFKTFHLNCFVLFSKTFILYFSIIAIYGSNCSWCSDQQRVLNVL